VCIVSTSGGPVLSIAAAFIVGAGAFFALAELGFFFPAVVALVFLTALRLPVEGLVIRFFEALGAGFFEALLRPFFFFVAILICSLFVGKA
jgi:hypothetical protein